MTRHFLNLYAQRDNYYRLAKHEQIDNIDQRLSLDIELFTGRLIALSLSFLEAGLTALLFSSVLWRHSHGLLLAAVSLAVLGTVAAYCFGRKLVRLHEEQFRLDADYRFQLVHLREHAEVVALWRGANRERAFTMSRFEDLIENRRRLANLSGLIGVVQNAVNLLKPILPMIVLAPAVLSGHLGLGVATQTAVAFWLTHSALTWGISNLPGLTEGAAALNRLDSLLAALNENGAVGASSISIVQSPATELRRLTVTTEDGGTTLIDKLTINLTRGFGVLVRGPSGIGKSSLVNALAGLCLAGKGVIRRPARDRVVVLAQEPYLPLGTFGDLVRYANLRASDEEVVQALIDVGLAELLQRHDLTDVCRWKTVLSLGEAQRIGFARLLLAKPDLAILDEATSALPSNAEARLYQLVRKSGIAFLSVGHNDSLIEHHARVLELSSGGRWQICDTADYRRSA